MLRIYTLLLVCIFFCCAGAWAQRPHQERANDKEVNAYVEKNYPKLWKEFKKIEKEGTAIEFFTSMKGPGRAAKGKIQLNLSYFNQLRPAFPEDRLIIVVLHEYGHVLYAKKMQGKKVERSFDNAVTNEYEAFKYSVEQAIIRAKAGDKGPLQQVLKNLKQRSEAGKDAEKDPHIPAINKLMKEDLWKEAKAQSKNKYESPVDLFNSFQDYSHKKLNADSAFYFVQKLASNEKYSPLLEDLIHNSFAQSFIQRASPDISKPSPYKVLAEDILAKMAADTTKLLLQTIQPMCLWKKAQDNKDNLSVLTDLTNEFIKEELSLGNVYKNSRARYGLMIYQIISAHNELNPLAQKMFNIISANLKENQIIANDSSSGAALDKRAYYRYLYAYTNYVKAKEAAHVKEKEPFLKTAFNYSPDLIDKDHRSAYFYDMVFLFRGEQKESFKPDYLEFLASETSFDKAKLLDLFLEVALIDPQYKKNNIGSDFNAFWYKAINTNAKKAPPILLPMLNETMFSSKQLSGKWILIDFWGTWCGPCRAENPQIQKFYDAVVLKKPDNMALLTIACRDNIEKVTAYLKEKKFSFPVAMSDNKIEYIYIPCRAIRQNF